MKHYLIEISVYKHCDYNGTEFKICTMQNRYWCDFENDEKATYHGKEIIFKPTKETYENDFDIAEVFLCVRNLDEQTIVGEEDFVKESRLREL